MTNKPRFLKNLLTTASTIAVVAGSANALAADVISINAGTAVFSVAGDWKANNANVTPAAGDNVIFGQNQDMTLNAAASTAYGTLNAYGFSKTITLATNITASFTDIVNNTDAASKAIATAANGGVANPGANNNARVNFSIGADGTMEFKEVTALGNITLTTADAKARFVSDNVTVTGTINALAAGNGIVEVNANNVTFTGAIGGVGIKQFRVLDSKSATIAANFSTNAGGGQDVFVANNATLNIGGAATIQVKASDISGVGDNQGTVRFIGPVILDSKVGDAHALAEVDFVSGTVELMQDKLKAKNINFSTGGVLKLSKDNTTITGAITAANDGDGKIQVNSNLSQITGNVGVGKKLGEIQFLVNKTLFFENSATDKNLEIHVGQFSTSIQKQGKVNVTGDNVLIDANFGTTNAPIARFSINTGAGGGAATVTLAPGTSIFADEVIGVDIADGAADNILILSEGVQIKAGISTSQDKNGILKVAGNSTVTSINVSGGNTINYVEFTTADKTLTLESRDPTDKGIKTTNGIKFSENATLDYTGKDTFVLGSKVEVKQDAAGTGSILANNIPTGSIFSIADAVGDVTVKDKYLKLLQVQGGADVSVGNIAIGKIDVGLQDVNLILGAPGEVFIGNFAHADGKATLKLNQDITLKAGSFKNDNRLKQIVLDIDRTITVEDGVNFSTIIGDGFRNNGGGQGALIFQGNSTVDAIIGVNNAFKEITVDGADKVVDFKRAVNLTNPGNGVMISNGGTAAFWDVVNAPTISLAGGGVSGTARFSNTAPITIAAGVGNVINLTTVEIAGNDVTFKGKYGTTQKLNFIGTGNSTVTFTDTSAIGADHFQNTIITTASKTRGHNIVLMKGKDQQFDLPVGSKDNNFGNIVLSGDDHIFINTQQFYAGVTTSTKDQGIVSFETAGAIALNLGASDSRLKLVGFVQSGIVKKDVYANNIEIDLGVTARFEGIVSSSNIMSLNDGAIASFASGSTLDSIINPVNNNKGTVLFDGDVSVSKIIGNGNVLNRVSFTGNGRAQLGANISSTTISFANGVTAVASADNVTLNGSTGGSAFDVSSNIITLQNGQSKLIDKSALNVTINSNGVAGKFVVDGSAGDSSFNLNNATGLTIFVQNNFADNTDAKYVLFTTSAGGAVTPIDANKVVVTPLTTDRFTSWGYDTANNALVRKNITTQVLADSVRTISDPDILADALTIANPNNTDDAKAVLVDFAKFLDNAALSDAIHRLTTPVEVMGKVVDDISSAGRQVVFNRLGTLSPTPGTQLSQLPGDSGIASGDDSSSKYGAWISPFYNQTTQKQRKGGAGYKATTSGGTIGFDIMTNADLSVGIAGTFAATEVKHRDYKSGDKTKANSFVFSVYGIQQLTNEWFMQGVASFSTSDVTNKENRRTSSGMQIAKGKFESSTLSGDLTLGYLQKVTDVTLIPTFGVGVTRINDGGYKETGTTNQNLDITKKSINKLEGIAGLRAQTEMFVNGVYVMPEVHGFVRHDLLGKTASVTVKLEGLVNQFAPKTTRPARTNYNLGLGVNARAGMFEYGAGYDCTMANKYLAHQGTVKVRVNF